MIELSKETLENILNCKIEDVKLKMANSISQLFPDNFPTVHDAELFADEVYSNMQNIPRLLPEDYPAICLMAATINQSNFYSNPTMRVCIDQISGEESFTDMFNKAGGMLSACIEK